MISDTTDESSRILPQLHPDTVLRQRPHEPLGPRRSGQADDGVTVRVHANSKAPNRRHPDSGHGPHLAAVSAQDRGHS